VPGRPQSGNCLKSSIITPRLATRFRSFLALGLAALIFAAPLSFTLAAQEGEALRSTDEQQAVEKTDFQPDPDAPQFVPGEIIVRYRTETIARGKENRTDYVSAEGERMRVSVERFEGEELVKGLRLARVEPEKTLSAIAALNKEPDVLYAEPNYIMHATALPNDPQFIQLWGLKNTGQSFNGLAGVPGADIDAELAWNITTGSSSVVVGVIDTGIDVSHPDLQPNIWTNPGEVAGNGLDDDGNGYIDDINGWDFANNKANVFTGGTNDPDDHGTHVAGTIGAKGNNNVGVAGVNWDVKLVSLKFLTGPNGSGSGSNAIAAMNYARTMKQLWASSGGTKGADIRILNNSWGGGSFAQSMKDAITQLNNDGILFVAAAGNSGTDNDDFQHYPANYEVPNIISVARTNQTDNKSPSSSFGKRTVHIGAPGNAIWSTTPNNTYSLFSGTSMAAPHVSGVAALILAKYPNITTERLRSALVYSGDPLLALSGQVSGARRLNAKLALDNAAETDPTPPSISGLTISSQTGRRVNLQFTAGDDGLTGTSALNQVTFSPPTGGSFLLASEPGSTGNPQTLGVNIPVKYTSGTITLKVFDNAGNGSASVSIPVSVDAGSADPYIVTTDSAATLSTGGTALALTENNKYQRDFTLPFAFPFFGQNRSTVTVSSNGGLYFSLPRVGALQTDAADIPSSTAGLSNQLMIAGMWDDLDLRPCFRSGADVYVVNGANSIIFRWEGIRFTSTSCPAAPPSGNPINFEIELRSNGTVITRYGEGNTGVRPVVGISAGETDALSGAANNAYIVSSHTSAALINLTNAQTVTFAIREGGNPTPNPTPTPTPTPTPVPSPSPPPPLPPPPTPTPVQSATLYLNSIEFRTVEQTGTGFLIAQVSRTGDTSAAASVDYFTSDISGSTPCQTNNTGRASDRCDYATQVGTLRWAAGDIFAKNIEIPIINDAYVEPTETFTITLRNIQGATLGQSTATCTIIDDDLQLLPTKNPITVQEFFIKQQYVDFLGRVAEPAGLQFWTDRMNNCPAGQVCDRTDTAKRFFESDEFKERGYYVYKLYDAVLGRQPQYSEFVPDVARLNGPQTPAEQRLGKDAYLQDLINKQEFRNLYGQFLSPDGLSATNASGFVDALITRSGITPASRQTLINNLQSGARTPAQTLEDFILTPEIHDVGTLYYDRAIITMQYFGFLRRNPDAGGFNFWWNRVATPGSAQYHDYRELVNNFLRSDEYNFRFAFIPAP
jgi:subtilisin family serine protease